jgi:putative ABC transport system permease protein
MAPARALKTGSAEDSLAGLARLRWSVLLAVSGALLLMLPPIAGLPVAAYLAIAAWLFAGIAFVPVLARSGARLLDTVAVGRLWQQPVAWLATARLSRSPGTVAAGLSGVVAAFALSAAMAIMVSSFRTSVADWLDAVLPADLYARAGATAAAPLPPAAQRAIADAPGIARAEFLRVVDLTLDPARPPVALIVRTLDPGAVQRQLPLTGRIVPAPPDSIPIWVSEAMVDLYGMRPGDHVSLPITAGARPAGTPAPDLTRFHVSGIWRDYARQHGAIVIARSHYEPLTGDAHMSDVSVWLADGVDAGDTIAGIVRADPSLAALDWRSAAEIRAVSLRIFDRSFAVTYALEAVALLVALFGVATASAGDALARAREFGMLRHLGMTARQVKAQLAMESAMGVAVAVTWGGAIGAAVGLVLIGRVNPQSFHWTMDVHWPIGLLAGSAAILVVAAVVTSLVAVRPALGDGPLRAVREDW